MKKMVRLTEGQLNNIVKRCVNEAVNEMATSSDNAVAKFQNMVEQINSLNERLKSEYGSSLTLMDNEGEMYELTQPVKLMGNGTLVISTKYGYSNYPDVEKVRVFAKKGGKVVLYKDDYNDNGDSRHARKLLNKLSKDLDRCRKHLEGYDPEWEDKEDGDPKAIARFNRSIGIMR